MRLKQLISATLICACSIYATADGADNSIKTVRQAEKKFDAIEGNEILFSPRLDGGDGRYYSFEGWIVQKKGTIYVSWFPDVSYDMPRIGFIIEKPKIIGEVHFRRPVRVVSKYIRNFSLPLANGSKAIVPVFTGGYIFALDVGGGPGFRH